MMKKPSPKRPRDANQLAKMVVDLATMDGDEKLLLKTRKVQEERATRLANTTRYSPAECIGITVGTVAGRPDKKHVSTSFAERSNLTLRMGCRRFTRLTNTFSKKIENHADAVALHMMFYNFGRIHKTLRITPAMQAGITDHVWSLEEIAVLAS